MGNFWCNFCGVKLTHDSASIRKKHFRGKPHIQNVQAYWATVANEACTSKVNQLDQTDELRAVLSPIGLEPILDVDSYSKLGKTALPSPKLYY